MGDVVAKLRHIAWVCLLGVGFAGACAPPPKPLPPVATPEPTPPPPPPKSCDTMEDECKASADTRSPIQKSPWSLAPPPTWTYAHDADALVARTDTARVGVTLRENGDKKTANTKRAAALELVTRKLGLTAPKKTPAFPAKPAKILPVGNLKIALYQFDGFTLEQKPGALLVFTTKLTDTQSLLGVGFVLESDANDADRAILTCVESLRADAQAGASDAGAP